LRHAIDELSRLEHGVPGLSSTYLQAKRLENDFPDDAEIKEELAQLNPLIDEFLRLTKLSRNQVSIFQDQFDDTHFKLLAESKDGFLQTASYFEKLAVLAVAVLGASISGLMAVVGHLAAGRALSGHSLINFDFGLYILALAIALVGQFSARFQADESLRRLVSKTSNAALKKSAFLLLNSEKGRNEEYERLKKEKDESDNRQKTVTFRITSTLSRQGGVLPSAGFIVVILIAIYMAALVLLWDVT
jgi:hypothetical protein